MNLVNYYTICIKKLIFMNKSCTIKSAVVLNNQEDYWQYYLLKFCNFIEPFEEVDTQVFLHYVFMFSFCTLDVRNLVQGLSEKLKSVVNSKCFSNMMGVCNDKLHVTTCEISRLGTRLESLSSSSSGAFDEFKYKSTYTL